MTKQPPGNTEIPELSFKPIVQIRAAAELQQPRAVHGLQNPLQLHGEFPVPCLRHQLSLAACTKGSSPPSSHGCRV